MTPVWTKVRRSWSRKAIRNGCGQIGFLGLRRWFFRGQSRQGGTRSSGGRRGFGGGYGLRTLSNRAGGGSRRRCGLCCRGRAGLGRLSSGLRRFFSRWRRTRSGGRTRFFYPFCFGLSRSCVPLACGCGTSTSRARWGSQKSDGCSSGPLRQSCGFLRRCCGGRRGCGFTPIRCRTRFTYG